MSGYDVQKLAKMTEEVTAGATKGLGRIKMSGYDSSRLPNLVQSVSAGATQSLGKIRMSGFSSNNPLRNEGVLNWYVTSDEYGFVELLHLTLCHAILDIEMGWKSSVG